VSGRGGRRIVRACNTKFSELSPGSLKSPDPAKEARRGKGSNSMRL